MGQRTDEVHVDVRETHRTSDDVRDDIRRIRQEMESTVGALQYRMSPEYMKWKMKKESREAGRGLVDRIKENPLPAAITGLGLFLLFRNNDRDTIAVEDYEAVPVGMDYGFEYDEYATPGSTGGGARGRAEAAKDRMSGAAHDAKDRVSGAAHSASERVHDATDTARDKARSAKESASRGLHQAGNRTREMGHRAGMQARRARREFWDEFGDNPLIMGAAGIALGAILGAIIPETDKEDELMGESAQRVRDRAKRQARDQGERVREVATTAASAAKNAAKDAARSEAESQGLTGEGRAASGAGTSGIGSTGLESPGVGSTGAGRTSPRTDEMRTSGTERRPTEDLFGREEREDRDERGGISDPESPRRY